MADLSPLVQALDHHLATRPDALALVDGARRVTWRALDHLARVHAARLAAHGVGAGERVAVQAGASPELVAAVVAHLRLGVVHVPVNTRYRDEEVEYVRTHAGARLLLHEADLAAAASDAPALAAWPTPPTARALAMLVYTSGTTGRPKGVMLAHDALAANLGAMMALWRIDARDVLCVTLPLFHVHGLGLGVLGALVLAGAALRLHARFDVHAVVGDFVAGAEPRASVFMGVPTMYHALLEHLDAHPADAAPLAAARLFTAGSAALSASDFERFRRHTGHAILERYGMTETGFTLSNPHDGERRPGTVGLPVPGARVRVVDDAGQPAPDGTPGEIEVRGGGLMDGYWRDPDATAAAFRDGWFRTGDVAIVEAGGYHRIVGRASTDIIKSGGFKIGAREIEDVLRLDARVAEAAVIGVPDPKWGEAIAAVVVLRAGVAVDADALHEDLRALVAQHLADFKRPRAVRVVAELPKNAMGKVQKAALRALFEAPAARSA